MAEPYRVKPDASVLREVLHHGGEELKNCYQCATCSVACELAPDDRPFPRKEMIWAQWGLKDKLLADPDIWLCYGCGDCTVRCPRGARPGDVLAAVREHTVEHYAVPSFMGKLAGHPKNLFLMTLIPVILILGLIAVFGDFQANVPDETLLKSLAEKKIATDQQLETAKRAVAGTDKSLADVLIQQGAMTPAQHQKILKEHDHVEYSFFLPHVPLILFFQIVTGLAALGALIGVIRYWKAINAQAKPGKRRSLVESAILALKEVLTHNRFRSCIDRRSRATSHLLVFYGFLGLFFVTGAVVVSKYIFHYYPIDWWHPLKWLGNISTVAMAIGLIMMIKDRSSGTGSNERSNPQDWMFLWLLSAVVITGAIVEVVRFADIALAAYPFYVVHLVLVFMLLVYLPYSRFAHLIYRTVALVHAYHTGRENPAGAASGR